MILSKIKSIFCLFSLVLLFLACISKTKPQDEKDIPGQQTGEVQTPKQAARLSYRIPYDVKVKKYFRFMDTLVAHLDTLVPYRLTEHLLVRANPWLIDTLAATDYYECMKKGIFVPDQREMVVLHEGETLFLPDSLQADSLIKKQQNTLIDVNIPEFRLRILEYGDTILSFPVRVGQNKKQYWEVTQRTADLRTLTGKGTIVRINRYPVVTDPVTGKKYVVTKRDDNKRTKLPQIPWIEPELNGIRRGQLIHPTTNASTLGKAYSNGCVGLKEEDSWRLYYHAPIGTNVVFRYNLTVVNEQGDTMHLRDIYGYRK